MRYVLAGLLIAMAFWGCQGKRTIPIAETSLAQKGKFEIVWVNPRIVYADTLCTLISAERLDSVFVRASEHSLGGGMPTVTFEVESPSCDVSATLVNQRGIERAYLFRKTMAKAKYKLTLSPEGLRKLSQDETEQIKVLLSLCGHVSMHIPTVGSPAQ